MTPPAPSASCTRLLAAPSRPLVSAMLVAIAIVASLAWWDERREADAALLDLETEQTVVASSLAASLRAHLAIVERDAELVAEHGPASRVERYAPVVVRNRG